MAVAGLSVSFTLVDVNSFGVPQFFWQMLLVPNALEQTFQLAANVFTTCLVHLSRNDIRAEGFPTGHLLDRFADLFNRRRGIERKVGR